MKPTDIIENCSKILNLDMSGIYMVFCIPSGKAYIGQSKSIKRRWEEHLACLKRQKHKNAYMQNLYNKYGKGNFSIHVLERDEGNLTDREDYFIRLLDEECKINIMPAILPQEMNEETRKKIAKANRGKNPFNKGYSPSKETREKISQALRGRKLSPEHYANVAESNKGRNLGHRHTEESKQKMSEQRKGRTSPRKGVKLTDEQKAKISASRKGIQVSEEAKQKISSALKGRPAHNKGKALSQETKDKISESMKAFRANS